METKPKHTPGPWRIARIEDGYALISSPSDIGRQTWDQFASVVVQMEGDMETTPVGEANARLIAAAPELLEALKGMMKAYDTEAWGVHLDRVPEWRAAQAAIAKAEGEVA